MFSRLIKLVATLALTLSISTAWATGVVHEGEVIDTMNSGGYTYVQIKKPDSTFWAAGPQVELSKGDVIVVQEQMWMNNFTSKTLDRTFDRLLFVGRIDKK